MGIIYKHTSPSGKSYIGQSIHTITKRLQGHVSHAKAGHFGKFHTAIRKYGIENFNSEVLIEVDNYLLNYYEILYIKKFNTYHNGYNSTLGGDSSGYSLDDKVKVSMSKGTQKYWDNLSEEDRLKHRDSCSKSTKKQWKNRTKEERTAVGNAISKANKGKPQPEWKKQKQSETMSGAGNSKAKKINIYDIQGNIQFECIGNFKKICDEYNLPHNALRKSHVANGEKIIQSSRSRIMAESKGWLKYIGWNAIEI